MREKFCIVRMIGQLAGLLFAIGAMGYAPHGFAADEGRSRSLILIVMDPLSAPRRLLQRL